MPILETAKFRYVIHTVRFAAAIAVALWSYDTVSTARAASFTCHSSASFRVAIRLDPEAAGSIIIATRRAAGDSKTKCDSGKRPGAFRVTFGDDEAAYFLALRGQFLILDLGTGPDRRIAVENLETRRTVLKTNYIDGPENVHIGGDAMTFWQVGDRISGGACLERRRRAAGLPASTPGHETRLVRFSYADATLTRLGPQRCTITQDDMP